MGVVRHLRCRRLSSPLSLSTSPLLHGFTLRASPAVKHGVSPPGTVGAGWEVSLFSPSPLSTLHSPRVHPSGITRGYAWCVPSGDSGCGLGGFFFLSLSTSPRVCLLGITRGYAWCVPAGDSEWTMSYFFSYQEKQTLGRNVFSHSCGLICRAQKYNKGVS